MLFCAILRSWATPLTSLMIPLHHREYYPCQSPITISTKKKRDKKKQTTMPAINPQQLVSLGTKTLRSIAGYYKDLGISPVLPVTAPGDLAKQFPVDAPQKPRSFDAILEDVETKIKPGLTQWAHPGFAAYYPANTTTPAVLADTMITAYGVVGLQWSSSPIATELEVVVMDWLAKELGFGGEFLHTNGRGGGMIQSTASDAMACIASAARVRHHQTHNTPTPEPLGDEGEDNEHPSYYADSSKLVLYMSTDTNLSGKKAARSAGLRIHQIKPQRLDYQGNYGITPEQVEERMERDIARGFTPCMILLNYGTTNTAGYDDIRSGGGGDERYFKSGTTFAEVKAKYGVWLHIDAAYAGASLVLPERQQDAKNMQVCADSVNLNGSKWLLCGFDSAFLFIKDKTWLTNTFGENAEFFNKNKKVLMQAESDEVYCPEFRDWGVPLGRKFRSLRVWMVFNFFGFEAVRAHISDTVKQAEFLRTKIDASRALVQMVRTDLSLVCVGMFHPTTKQNLSLAFLTQFNTLTQGKFLLLQSKLGDEPFIRIALGGVNTTQEDIEAMWKGMLLAQDAVLDAEEGKSGDL